MPARAVTTRFPIGARYLHRVAEKPRCATKAAPVAHTTGTIPLTNVITDWRTVRLAFQRTSKEAITTKPVDRTRLCSREGSDTICLPGCNLGRTLTATRLSHIVICLVVIHLEETGYKHEFHVIRFHAIRDRSAV